MSYRTFFMFAQGIAKPMRVPARTLEACRAHVERVTRVLGFTVETDRGNNPPLWRGPDGGIWLHPKEGVRNALFCKTVEQHNRWVRWFYEKLTAWSNLPPDAPLTDVWRVPLYVHPGEDALALFPAEKGKTPPSEMLTPEDARTFWYGLQSLEVPIGRWTSDYYRARMEHLYEVMRGRENEGVTFDAKRLSPKQAAAVMNIFSTYVDPGDLRLDVPNGHDYLASSSDGGYEWCEKCGPAHPDDAQVCRRKACPIRDEEEDRRFVLKDKAAGVYLGTAPGAWPTKLGKKVLHFNARSDAENHAQDYPKRTLTVIPVRVCR